VKEVTEIWAARAEAQGIKVVGKELFPSELKDFSSVILKIRAAKPDIIYISSFDNASVALVQQLRQQRIHALDVHHSQLTGALARLVGNSSVEGMTSELAWYPDIKGDYSDLAERVFAHSGIDMFDTITSMSRFTSYIVMVQAIERAGAVDREKVKDVLFKGTFKAPPGDLTFDDRGLSNTTDFTIQMQSGKVVVVWPEELATGKVRWPSPTWQ